MKDTESEAESEEKIQKINSETYKPHRVGRMQKKIKDIIVEKDAQEDNKSKFHGNRRMEIYPKDKKESQRKNKFVYLGNGRPTKAKHISEPQKEVLPNSPLVKNKFPNFDRINESPTYEKQNSMNDLFLKQEMSVVWSPKRKRNKNKFKSNGFTANKRHPFNKNGSEEKDTIEHDFLTKFDVQKTKVTKGDQTKLQDTIEEAETKRSKKELKVQPFLHLAKPVLNLPKKTNNKLEGYKSDKSDLSNSTFQKQHYVYPELHYKSSLQFSNNTNDPLNHKMKDEKKEEDGIFIPDFITPDQNINIREKKVRNKKALAKVSSLTPETPNIAKSVPGAHIRRTETGEDLALALRLVTMFKSFKDLHIDRTNLHSDLKHFLLEISRMLR